MRQRISLVFALTLSGLVLPSLAAAQTTSLDSLQQLFGTDPATAFEEAWRIFQEPMARGDLDGMMAIIGVVLPGLAFLVFLVGILFRVVKWARAPVPFRIPTTSGQQRSLPWIANQELESPSGTLGVLGRMVLEVLFFRSLFRNVKSEVTQGKVVHGANKWLWGAALLFHYSFLVIFIRHLRFFTEPVPFFIHWAESLDGFFQVGVPFLFLTDLVIVAAATYLFLRRVVSPQLRYISLIADYFPLFLILSIATSGILLRYFVKTDIVMGYMKGRDTSLFEEPIIWQKYPAMLAGLPAQEATNKIWDKAALEEKFGVIEA